MQVHRQLGLDQPVWKQFADYCGQLLHGDFGTSLATNQSVLSEFAALFPATLELSFFAMLFAALVGLPATPRVLGVFGSKGSVRPLVARFS